MLRSKLKLAWIASGLLVLALSFLQNQNRSSIDGFIDENPATLTSGRAGLVNKIFIKSGDRVSINQPLAEVVLINKDKGAQGNFKTGKKDSHSGTEKDHSKSKKLDEKREPARHANPEIENWTTINKTITLTATKAGIIGDITAKVGDYISAGDSILSVYDSPATTAHAFLEEKSSSSVGIKEGDEVFVRSISNPKKVCKGRIITVAPRFVEIPSRLVTSSFKLTKDEAAWGREVIVELADSSSFFAQERIRVFTTGKSFIEEQKSLFNLVLSFFGIDLKLKRAA